MDSSQCPSNMCLSVSDVTPHDPVVKPWLGLELGIVADALITHHCRWRRGAFSKGGNREHGYIQWAFRNGGHPLVQEEEKETISSSIHFIVSFWTSQLLFYSFSCLLVLVGNKPNTKNLEGKKMPASVWEHVCICDNSPRRSMWFLCVRACDKWLCGEGTASFCSVSFLFPSFSRSKKICLKVDALCYPTAPEYNNRRSFSCQKTNKK